MPWPSPHAADLRAEAERRLRETAEPMAAIAADLGLPRSTLTTWNRLGGWRRTRSVAKLNPADWPQTRREAIARLYYEPRNHPHDLAEAMGLSRHSASAVFKAVGLVLRRTARIEARAARARPMNLALDPAQDVDPAGPLDAAGAADGARLRAALRGHVARQIAGFDAALQGQGAAVLDSARVLRDLGGLKKLLDELGTAEGGDAGAGRDAERAHRLGDEHEPDDGDADLPALRAEIARRLGLAAPARDPGAAAAGPRPGARP